MGVVRYAYVVEGEISERVRRGYENDIQTDLRKTVGVKTSTGIKHIVITNNGAL
jgi:hypothetical protein